MSKYLYTGNQQMNISTGRVKGYGFHHWTEVLIVSQIDAIKDALERWQWEDDRNPLSDLYGNDEQRQAKPYTNS